MTIPFIEVLGQAGIRHILCHKKFSLVGMKTALRKNLGSEKSVGKLLDFNDRSFKQNCVCACMCVSELCTKTLYIHLIDSSFLIPFVLFLLPINIDESYLKKICILKIFLKINFQTLIQS